MTGVGRVVDQMCINTRLSNQPTLLKIRQKKTLVLKRNNSTTALMPSIEFLCVFRRASNNPVYLLSECFP